MEILEEKIDKHQITINLPTDKVKVFEISKNLKIDIQHIEEDMEVHNRNHEVQRYHLHTKKISDRNKQRTEINPVTTRETSY